MPYPPRDGDLPMVQVTQQAYDLLTNDLNMEIYLKWTCPACGERVMSDDKLKIVIAPDGSRRVLVAPAYLHTEKDNGDPCMHSVKWDQHVFGFATVSRL